MTPLRLASGSPSTTDLAKRRSTESSSKILQRDTTKQSVYSALQILHMHDGPDIAASHSPLPTVLTGGALQRTTSRGLGSISTSSSSNKSVSHFSGSIISRWRRGKMRFTNTASHENEVEQDEVVMVGFVKRSAGLFSMAWLTDAMSNQSNKDPGHGWRPFKAMLVHETLMFFKVPATMVPEVRRTFQIRSTQWPASITASDEVSVLSPDSDKEETESHATTLPDSSTVITVEESDNETMWKSFQTHPELLLVPDSGCPGSWAARIDRGTPAALAHELVFGTQQPACGPERCESDTKTFLHLVFYSLGTTHVPWHLFLLALREYLGMCTRANAGIQRVALFVDLLLWKRPLLHAGHEYRFFHELDALITQLAQIETSSYAPMRQQLCEWQMQVQQHDPCMPTDWLNSTRLASNPGRIDLAPLSQCWNAAVLVRQDPSEVARQIQSFHVDRLMAFLRVPVTAYRLSSSVTETILRSFRFDATRPHWITHVILRQLLVDEAPERQGEAVELDRALVLQHWISIAASLLHNGDLAGWVAVCAALCSRAVASLDMLWRGLPTTKRDLVTLHWSPKLTQFGWIEGVHAPVEPILAIDGAGHVAMTPGGVPYFGNAGILDASSSNEAAPARVQVPVASQEPEFNRVRSLALQIGSLFERGMPMPMGPAPIPEYQALFQRLSTYEFVLQTGLTDYVGSAVIADGCVMEHTYVDKPTDWLTTPVPDADTLFTFPTPFAALMPTRLIADSIMERNDVFIGDKTDMAYASLPRCAARAVTHKEEILMNDELVLYPMHPQLWGSKSLSKPSIGPASPNDVPPTELPKRRFSVEVRAASSRRLLDILVLGTAHLIVRAPIEPRTNPVRYQVLGVDLDFKAFLDACLLSYRGWISPAGLLEALMHRWHAAESACREMALHARMHVPNQFPSWTRPPNAQYAREPMDAQRVIQIRLHVLEVLQRWLELYPREWIADLVLFDTLYKFLHEILAECTNIASDSPVLVEAIHQLFSIFPTLTTSAISAMGLDCFSTTASTPMPTVARAFDWSLSAADLVVYLESMMALPYSLLQAHDLALTMVVFEQMHTARHAWLEAVTEEPNASLSIFRLLRLLPSPVLPYTRASRDASLFDVLPPSVRELCRIHEVIRDWTETQVTEPRIGLDRRMERVHRLIDAVLLSRASMAHRIRRSSASAPEIRSPLPLTFVESAVLEGLTSARSQAHRAAWEHLATSRGVRVWADLLAHAPDTLPPGLPPCTPDIGWTMTVLANWAARAKARQTQASHLLEFSRYMSAMDLITDSIHLQRQCLTTDLSLDVARARLVWLRDFVSKATWSWTVVMEDAALEASFQGFPFPAPVQLFAGLELAREQKRLSIKGLSVLPPQHKAAEATSLDSVELPTPAAPAAPKMPEIPPIPNIPHHPDDSLLRAVPTMRVSYAFRCTGASLSVWPYHQHPFVLQLCTPGGQKCTLKLPNYDEFCRWIASLQALSNVRMAEAFDAGTYAAQVAEYLGRASAGRVFGVPLRELALRTGNLPLPPVIERVLEEIESRGLNEQGIYRISGTRNAMESLQRMLDTQPIHQISLAHIDIHVLTSAVKLWLRELPEPVVPFAYYDALIETERIIQHDVRVKAMRDIVRLFPRCHYLALQRVTYHLTLVAKCSKMNLMAAHNIGLVFGSTLLNPPSGTGSVARGLENLGRAAHVVKIAVLMHRQIFGLRTA